MSFQLKSVQISLFLKERIDLVGSGASEKTTKLLNLIVPSKENQAPPSILPVPDNAPDEFPRIIVSSIDQSISVQVFPKRVNILFNEIQPKHLSLSDIDLDQIAKIVDIFDKDVNRIGFVGTFQKKLTDVISEIKKRLLTEYFPDIQDVYLRFVERIEENKYNKVISISPTRKINEGIADADVNNIDLIIDLNTPAEKMQEYALDSKEVKEEIKNLKKILSEIDLENLGMKDER